MDTKNNSIINNIDLNQVISKLKSLMIPIMKRF